MHRIDSPGNIGGLFVSPNPLVGQPAVVATVAWLNDIQENIIAVLAAAGIAPVKGTYTQLRDAIEDLVASSAVAFASNPEAVAEAITNKVISPEALGAVLATSPALGGNPTAPTQSPGNNSTRIATTAYVDRAATAPAAVAKAWVTFVGSTGVILDSYNVSSVVRNTTSDYTVNFTNALADTHYALVPFGGQSGVTSLAANDFAGGWVSKAVGAARFLLGSATTGGVTDADEVTLIVFGN